MSKPSLERPRLKADRARQHLAEFQRRADEFTDSNPCVTSRHIKDGGRKHIYRVESIRQPPDDLGPVIGDVVQVAAAALDYLVFELSRPALPGLKDRDKRKIGFPIYTDPALFRKDRGGRIGHIPGRAQTDIERLQPFQPNSPFGAQLQNLYELSIINRHRTSSYGAANIGGHSIALPGGVPRPSEVPYFGVLEPQTLIVCFTFPSPQPSVDMDFDPKIGVAFREPPGRGRSIWPALNQICYAVDEIIEQFRPYFP